MNHLALVLAVRVVASFPPVHSTGITDWPTLVATLLLVGITAWYAWHTRDMARTTNRSTRGEMLLRLNELYADNRTIYAIRFMDQL